MMGSEKSVRECPYEGWRYIDDKWTRLHLANDKGGEIKVNTGGWGEWYNPNTSKPIAAFVNGKSLKNKAGVIRTFGEVKSAIKAIKGNNDE